MVNLGPKRIMGLAVGNEVELIRQECNINSEEYKKLWAFPNGRYWSSLQSRVEEMDNLTGFKDTHIPITAVWSGYVTVGWPFVENENAKVRSLVKAAHAKWGNRWIWSFNVNSYWDISMW